LEALVILGTGLAGYTLAREFRKLDPERALVLITNDDGAFYSKPMLSNALAKNKTAEALIQQTAEQMAETLNATIVTHTVVDNIDTAQHVVSAGDKQWTYGQLVLAVGASQIKLPIAGDGGPDLYPLQHLMPEPAGRALQTALTEKGVTWHLEDTVTEVKKSAGGYTLTLNKGTVIEADLVLSAAGLRPNTALAKSAGIEVGHGIIADKALATSAPGVFSFGDCAEIAGMIMPYVLPIMHSARVLAQTLSGNATTLTLPAMPVGVKTPAHAIVVSPAARGAEGEWHCEEQSDGGQIALFKSPTGDLLGFALTGAEATKQRMVLAKQLPPVLA